MRRSPQEVVNTLAYALKEGKQGDEFKLSELAKRTSMSYVTVQYYLDLIEHVQKNIPMIEVVEKPRTSHVKILKEIDLKLSDAENMLLQLFDRKAFGEAFAVSIDQFPKEAFFELDGSLISMTSPKKIYLSTKGIIEAATLAGIRADAAISSKERKVIESGVWEAEEWIAESILKKGEIDQVTKSTAQNTDLINLALVNIA